MRHRCGSNCLLSRRRTGSMSREPLCGDAGGVYTLFIKIRRGKEYTPNENG